MTSEQRQAHLKDARQLCTDLAKHGHDVALAHIRATDTDTLRAMSLVMASVKHGNAGLAHRMLSEELLDRAVTARDGNPALAALRHHVTGAIERGEAQAIAEVRAETGDRARVVLMTPDNERGKTGIRTMASHIIDGEACTGVRLDGERATHYYPTRFVRLADDTDF